MTTSRFQNFWTTARSFWNKDVPNEDLDKALEDLRQKAPAPVFWMLGKTQTGKTSIIRYLTKAEDAAIGNGFRPTTRTTREYPFPHAEAPILTFLDTRGLDEPGYDPTEDIHACEPRANVIIVTVKLKDFAQGSIKSVLEKIRSRKHNRPVLLTLTCLHEAYPQQQHVQPYPYADGVLAVDKFPGEVPRLIAEQKARFAGLYDYCIAIDFTQPDEGYEDTNYGGQAFKKELLGILPKAYQENLIRVQEFTQQLKDIHLKHAIPVIIGYSSLAASAGAIPVPFMDLFLLPSIQSRMVFHLAKLYGRPLDAQRFMELATSMGMGVLARQAIRGVVKFIPFVGSAAGSALAWASTYALGRAFCVYYQEIHAGHIPDAQKLKAFYQEQLSEAERRWSQ